jgi:hypothetical protein
MVKVAPVPNLDNLLIFYDPKLHGVLIVIRQLDMVTR